MTQIKNRKPLQVSPIFKDKLDDIYRQLWKIGRKPSYRKLTEDIVNSPLFNEIEKQILSEQNEFDINIRFDRRNK